MRPMAVPGQYPWVRGGWGLDALEKFFRRRRRRRRRPPGMLHTKIDQNV